MATGALSDKAALPHIEGATQQPDKSHEAFSPYISGFHHGRRRYRIRDRRT
jgi:hypothetical protein